jgi:hypothetical protein
MGYRSDVKIVVIASSKEAMDDLLAVYAMLPEVQKAGGFEELGWERYELGEGRVLTYEADDVKWYDSYDDVTVIMRLLEDVSIFNQERSEDVYAARFVRVGEQYDGRRSGKLRRSLRIRYARHITHTPPCRI